MRLSRRDFLKLAGAVGVASTIPMVTLEKALAGNGDPRVIWLQGQSCSGCSVSLMNCIETVTVDTLLTEKINLEYHSTLIAAAGELALSGAFGPHPSLNELASFSDDWLTSEASKFDLSGPTGQPDGNVNLIDYAALCRQGYILVVEGAIPMGADGVFCDIGHDVNGSITMKGAFDTLARNADAVLSVGTCASYGGIPAAPGNPTGAVSVAGAMEQLGITKGFINIPGCPIHPEWFVDVVIKILAGESIVLEDNGEDYDKHRPAFLFGTSNSQRIHNSCPMKGTGQAANLGETGCKRNQGCRGEFTWGHCPSHKWNNGVSWCIQTMSTCTGCTEPNYPGTNPLFEFYTPPSV